ncbi:hypothetical protein Tco_1224575, partial [Tanacetum coccineum]
VGEWHLNTVGKFRAVKSVPLPSGDVFTVYEDPANTAMSSQCHYHQQKTMPMKQENNLSHELQDAFFKLSYVKQTSISR